MISTLITNSCTCINYPCLMQATAKPGLVVLFSGPSAGMVVAVPHGEEIYEVGHHSTVWADPTFKIFEGELNLCNEPQFDEDDEESIEGEDDGEGHVLGGLAAAAQGKGQSCAGCTGCDEDNGKVDTTKAGVLSARYGSLDELLRALTRGTALRAAHA